MNLDALLNKYNSLISKQNAIPFGLDEWDFDSAVYPIHNELLKVIIEIAKDDIPIARKVLLDYVNKYSAKEKHQLGKLAKFLNQMLTYYRHDNEKIFDVFRDEELLRAIKSKQGSLMLCGECSRSYLQWYGLLSEYDGYAYLLEYCLKIGDSNTADLLLSLITINEQPHLVFEALNKSTALLKHENINAIINKYISNFQEQYKIYLKIKLLDREKKLLPVEDCMEAIEVISIPNNYYWFEQACTLFAKKHSEMLPDMLRYILNKYSNSYNNANDSKWVFLAILNASLALKNHNAIYDFMLSNFSIYDIAISKLNVYIIDEYAQHLKYFTIAIKNDDAILLDRLFQALSLNPYVKNFDETYLVILENRPELTAPIINILKKWKMRCTAKSDNLLSYYSTENLMTEFSAYLEKCMFTSETSFSESNSLMDWCRKIANDNLELLPNFYEVFISNIEERKTRIKNLLAKKHSNQGDDYYTLQEQINDSIPHVEYSAMAAFIRLFEIYDLEPMCKLVHQNSTSYDFICYHFSTPLKKINQTPISYLYPHEVIQVFENKYRNNFWLKDNEFIALSKLLFNDNSIVDCDNSLKHFEASNDEAEQLVELKLRILNLWSSDQIDSAITNRLRMNFFVKLVPMKAMKDMFELTGKIPSGVSYIFFETVNELAKTDLNLALEALNMVLPKLCETYSVPDLVFGCMSVDNYIEIIKTHKILFDLTVTEQKLFFKLIRSLLGDYEFEKILDLLGRVISENNITEAEVCSGLQGMLLLKANVKEIDVKQLDFLDNLCLRFSSSQELGKLQKRLANLRKKIGG